LRTPRVARHAGRGQQIAWTDGPVLGCCLDGQTPIIATGTHRLLFADVASAPGSDCRMSPTYPGRVEYTPATFVALHLSARSMVPSGPIIRTSPGSHSAAGPRGSISAKSAGPV